MQFHNAKLRLPTSDFRLPSARQAFTLLEVILSLTILAAAAAMIGELISFASQNAVDSEAETRAQFLAISLMDEMVSKRTEVAERSEEPLDTEDAIPWVYSVSIERTKLSGLSSVEIIVEQDLEKKFRPVKYRLVRWLPKSLTSSKGDDSTDASAETDASDQSEASDE